MVDPAVAELQQAIYENNVRLGWRDRDDHGEPDFGEAMFLLMSEIAEAGDAWRRWGFGDPTPDGLTEAGLPHKPEGVGSEFADVYIRALDTAHLFGIGLPEGIPGRPGGPCWAAPDAPDAPVSFLGQMLKLAGDVCKTEEAFAWYGNGRQVRDSLAKILGQLGHYCQAYGIDLLVETERKMAYNATRPFRHGRKRL